MPLLLLFLALFSDFRQAVPGYHFQFPRDHFDHPEFRTEWWYYTGNLQAAGGHRYGFELVFFRQGQRRGPAANPSTWRIDDLYLAHFAITDIDGRRFRFFKRLNRAGPGIAGISFDEHRIWNGNWQSRWDLASDSQDLTAFAEGSRISLHLTPRKPAIIQGENGVSQKSDGEGKASYYVSFPLLEAEGTLDGTPVKGTAWMDHEWFSNQLDPSVQGWDWFSVQLANNTQLMLFQLRHTDGTIDSHSSGTYIDAAGRSTHLKRSDVQLQPLEFWESPKTHARYPTRWRIAIPSLQTALECTAAIPDQELLSGDATGPTYWEGAVTYKGSATVVGYLEMTGYAKPVRL